MSLVANAVDVRLKSILLATDFSEVPENLPTMLLPLLAATRRNSIWRTGSPRWPFTLVGPAALSAAAV